MKYNIASVGNKIPTSELDKLEDLLQKVNRNPVDFLDEIGASALASSLWILDSGPEVDRAGLPKLTQKVAQ